MTSRERVLVYSLLTGLLVMNVIIALGGSGPTATANVLARSDDLGPADRLILSGEQDLVVRNADGRLAWSENAHGRAYSIAFVHQQDVLEKLMQTSQYKDDRDRLTDDIKKEEEEWRTKYQALRDEYADVESADDPRSDEAQAALGAWQRDYQQWQQSASARVNTMAVEQLQRAYRELIAAVEIVADQRQVDLVLQFTPTVDDLPASQNAQTMLDIRMRPVLKYPEGLDITVEVLDDLALGAE